MNVTIITPYRQVKKFKEVRRYSHPMNEFGCTGFYSYGFIQDANGEVYHVMNPDYNWKEAYSKLGTHTRHSLSGK